MLQKTYITLLFLLVASCAFAQKTERDYLRSGNKLYNDSLFIKAEVDYRKALEINPKSTDAMFNLGNSLLMQQKAKEAMEQFESASKVEKDRDKLAQIYHNMGVILQSSKQYPQCIEAYKESLRNNPKDDETRYNLALAQKLLKDQQQNQDQNQDKNQDQKQNQKDDKKDQNKDQQEQDKKDQQNQNQQQQQQNKDEKKEKAEFDYGIWDNVVSELQALYPSYASISLTAGKAQISKPGNMRSSDTAAFDTQTGEITTVTAYSDVPRAQKMKGWFYAFHTGSWGGMTTKVLYFLAAFIGGILPLSGYYLWLKKKRLSKKKVFRTIFETKCI